jgi:membrane-bound lytic murein transglycosylase MltF
MRKKKQKANTGVIIFFVIVLIVGITSLFTTDLIVINYDINENVKEYKPLITKYAKEYDIEDYVPLIMSVMMQESKGKGTDPMQASECIYNKQYSVEPNGIKDPEYSIDTGVHYLALCLQEANVESPTDEEHISLALQGYNYGHGYIKWALKNYGGYSKENAVEFSDKMKEELDQKKYGDTNYVAHVLKYYSIEEKNG